MFVTEEMEFFDRLTMLILLDGFCICLQPHTKDLIYHDIDPIWIWGGQTTQIHGLHKLNPPTS